MFKIITRKIKDNLLADTLFFKSKLINPLQKFIYFLNKYLAIATNSEKVFYLNNYFYYDNRFTPILLQFYPKQVDFLTNNINFSKIATVLDIGANIGQWPYTLKSFFPNVKIFSFEPDPDAFKYLIKNASYFDNWTIYNYGVGLSNTKKTLYTPVGASAAASFIKNVVGEYYPQKRIVGKHVNVINFSENIHILKLPLQYDLIKIDVEGYELQVLKSLKDIKFKYLQVEIPYQSKRDVNIERIERILVRTLKKRSKLLEIHRISESDYAADALFEIID